MSFQCCGLTSHVDGVAAAAAEKILP